VLLVVDPVDIVFERRVERWVLVQRFGEYADQHVDERNIDVECDFGRVDSREQLLGVHLAVLRHVDCLAVALAQSVRDGASHSGELPLLAN